MKKKIVVLGLAGCLTLSSVSFAIDGKNVDKNTKNKIIIPAPISSESIGNKVKVESKTIKSNIDNVKVNIKIPVVKGLKDAVYQEKLNHLIEDTAKKELKEFEEQAKELSKLNIEWKPEMNVEYEIKSEGDILSFVVDSYFYTGGAHGISRKDYYNIDANDSKAIELADLFKENSDFKTIINDEINKQIKEQVAEGEKSYFTGENGFVTINDDSSFYIDKDGNLVITFQQYDIAPGYMGHPEFKIPNESIVQILKNVKPVVIKDEYHNYKYNFKFKIAPIWKNKVDIIEEYDANNKNLEVNFIYSPANEKLKGEKLLTISVVDKKNYKEDEKSFPIGETKSYVYLATVPQANPYDSKKPEGKEFAKLSQVLDGIDDLFQVTEVNEIINFDKVIINGKELKLKKPMFKSENGTVMMPLAEVARALDFKVTWNGKNKVANINKGSVSAGAYAGKDQYYFSKALVHLGEKTQLIKGTTFVPVSFIDEVIKGEKVINSDGVLNIKY
jgi:hypothetical protein